MEAFIGTILAFAGNFAPRGWMMCQGQLLPINQYSALFAILGTTYGGNGQTTFGLPDLRGRTLVGMGQGPGLSNVAQGQQWGTENVTLLTTQIPAHTHPTTVALNAAANDVTALSNVATGNTFASDAGGRGGAPVPAIYSASKTTVALGALAATATAGVAGGSQGHPNVQPSLGINYIICLEGIFPSRQ